MGRNVRVCVRERVTWWIGLGSASSGFIFEGRSVREECQDNPHLPTREREGGRELYLCVQSVSFFGNLCVNRREDKLVQAAWRKKYIYMHAVDRR